MKVRVSDNEGTWLEDDGSTIITVWTSEGWRSLPGEYDAYFEQHDDADDVLFIEVPEVQAHGTNWRLISVNPDDFEEVA